jgi:hypothetical protein
LDRKSRTGRVSRKAVRKVFERVGRRYILKTDQIVLFDSDPLYLPTKVGGEVLPFPHFIGKYKGVTKDNTGTVAVPISRSVLRTYLEIIFRRTMVAPAKQSRA